MSFVSIYIDTQTVSSKFAKTIIDQASEFKTYNVHAFIHLEDLNKKDYEKTKWVKACDTHGIDLRIVSTWKTNISYHMLITILREQLQTSADTVVLVTNSNNFEPLVKELQRIGKNVHAMCEQDVIEESSIYYFNNFYNLTYFYEKENGVVNTHIKFKPSFEERLCEVDTFIQTNSRLPSTNSKNDREKKMGKFLKKCNKHYDKKIEKCKKKLKNESFKKAYEQFIGKYSNYFETNVHSPLYTTLERSPASSYSHSSSVKSFGYTTPPRKTPTIEKKLFAPLKRKITLRKPLSKSLFTSTLQEGVYNLDFIENGEKYKLHVNYETFAPLDRRVLFTTDKHAKSQKCKFSKRKDGSYTISIPDPFGVNMYLTTLSDGSCDARVKNEEYKNQTYEIDYDNELGTIKISTFDSKTPLMAVSYPMMKGYVLSQEESKSSLGSLVHDNLYQSNQIRNNHLRTFHISPSIVLKNILSFD